MALVESTVLIKSDIDKVIAIARDVEAYPQFMPDVKSVTILERSEDGLTTITEFVGIIKEFKTTMKWTAKDVWDLQAKRCEFNLVKGDFKSYSGVWTLEQVGDSTKFTSSIEFEYDIPMIGPMIKSLIQKKMQQNVENMLAAIKNKLEG